MLDKQYYILVRDPMFNRVATWVWDNDIPNELHANRMRFRPHSEALLVQFFLQWAPHCPTVEPPYSTVF